MHHQGSVRVASLRACVQLSPLSHRKIPTNTHTHTGIKCNAKCRTKCNTQKVIPRIRWVEMSERAPERVRRYTLEHGSCCCFLLNFFVVRRFSWTTHTNNAYSDIFRKGNKLGTQKKQRKKGETREKIETQNVWNSRKKFHIAIHWDRTE